MPKIIEKFDKTVNEIPDDRANDYSFLVLSDLGHRSIAIESVLFTYNHLRYMQNRILVVFFSKDVFSYNSHIENDNRVRRSQGGGAIL